MKAEKYFCDYGSQLGARHFGEIDSGDGDFALNGKYGDERLTRKGARLRHWKHSGSSGEDKILNFLSGTDMPFIRFLEKQENESRLT